MYVCITRLGDWTGYVLCSGPDGVTIEQDWETYYQTDDSRSAGGSGLGLSIAKSLTEMMGGMFKIGIDADLFKANLSLKKDNA